MENKKQLNRGENKEIENMNGNLDEKNSGEERILNDELMAKVTGGEITEGWIFTGSFVCPLCGQNHRFKFAPGDIMHGYHFDFVDEGNHCGKIDYLYDVKSVNFETKTGIVEMRTTDADLVSTVFFIVGM